MTVAAPLSAGEIDDPQHAIETMLLQYRDLATFYALRRPDQFWWRGLVSTKEKDKIESLDGTTAGY